VLLHDTRLLGLFDGWMMSHNEENFIALLPALRRAMGSFDAMERRRIIEAAIKGPDGKNTAVTAANLSPQFAEVLPLLKLILGSDTKAKGKI
jgi:hypothetical protein